MKVLFTAIALLAQSASCFTTQNARSPRYERMSLNEAEELATPEVQTEQEVIEEPENPFLYKVTGANGWVPDEAKPCFGLPGVVAPTGYFDPIGMSI